MFAAFSKEKNERRKHCTVCESSKGSKTSSGVRERVTDAEDKASNARDATIISMFFAPFLQVHFEFVQVKP